METRELMELAGRWDAISRSSPLADSQRSGILLSLRRGTPERAYMNHVRFFDYLNTQDSRNIFMRILQSEAERSEV